MADHIFDLKSYAVDITRYTRGVNVDAMNSVRCYRSSPERVSLQIRGEKSYATASLPFDVARAIADALKKECE